MTMNLLHDFERVAHEVYLVSPHTDPDVEKEQGQIAHVSDFVHDTDFSYPVPQHMRERPFSVGSAMYMYPLLEQKFKAKHNGSADAVFAFIAGHELEHIMTRLYGGQGPYFESQCDVRGAAHALAAGYDIKGMLGFFDPSNNQERNPNYFSSAESFFRVLVAYQTLVSGAEFRRLSDAAAISVQKKEDILIAQIAADASQ